MIMLTGGAGYIGSHVCVALLKAGLDVVAVDNLSNSNKTSLERVQSICGRSPVFRQADIRDEEAIYEILRACGVTAVIHLAGLKAVGDSNVRPMTYYENNVLGTMRLVSAMEKAKVKTLVFSSSATVYGRPTYLPLDEKHPLGPTNPYGRTKVFIENPEGSLQVRRRLADRYSALLQSGWRARKRAHWRRPAGRSQQPAAVCGTSGDWKTRQAADLGPRRTAPESATSSMSLILHPVISVSCTT